MRENVVYLLGALLCTFVQVKGVDLGLPNPANVFRLKDVVESNPILKKLSMFSNEDQYEDITIGSTTEIPQTPIVVYSPQQKAESAERKTASALTTARRKQTTASASRRHDQDNFNDDYKKLNDTLFREAIPLDMELPMRTIGPPETTKPTKAAIDNFFADHPDPTATLEPFTPTIPFNYEDLDANWIDENNSNLGQTTPTPYSYSTTTAALEVTRFPTFANRQTGLAEREKHVEPESTTPFEVDERIFSTTAVAEYHANNTYKNHWAPYTTSTLLPYLSTTVTRSHVYPSYTMTAEPERETYTTPSYADDMLPPVTHQPVSPVGDYDSDNSLREPIPPGHLTEVQGYRYRFQNGKTYQVNEDYDGHPKNYEKVMAMSDYLIPEPTRRRLEKMKTAAYPSTTTRSPMGIFNLEGFDFLEDNKQVLIPYGKAPSIFSIPQPLKQAEMVAVEIKPPMKPQLYSTDTHKEPMVKRNNSPLKYFPAYMTSSEEEENSSEEYYDTHGNELPTSSPIFKENTLHTPEPLPAFSEKCFQNKKSAILVNVTPFERRINVSPTNCLIFCSEFKNCRSVVYSYDREICDVYNVKSGHAMAKLVDLEGYIYLETKEFEILKDCIQGGPSQNAAKIYHPHENLAAINARRKTLESNYVNTDGQQIEVLAEEVNNVDPAGNQLCPDGQDTIMMRSTGYRLAFFRGETYRQNVSESDCRFSCLMNLKDNYEPFNCVSTLYDRASSECTHMQSGAGIKGNSLIEYDKDTVYYEKLCVSNSLADLCDGRVLERIPQHTLLGYIRDVRNASSALNCIEMCRSAATSDGSCRSVIYFHQETSFNCFLSLVSREVDKDLFTGESDTSIDYISLENCLDQERVIKRKPQQDAFYEEEVGPAQLKVDSDEGVLSLGK
ncbi:hypothetical protein L596_010189 [Steinernema carpocapsae]|uniref:Apple domain-containing protein n=1 Tax=Steinernema carpocapsae TaxID=34508 RepID=A0A4U5PI54_STECR|nr:hypothetical protein L596_010189 [Steinernema carpocapsae]